MSNRERELEAWSREVRETVAKEVAANLVKRRNGVPLRVLQTAHEFADHNIAGIARIVNAGAAKANTAGIACGAGCAACCHVRVTIMPIEAIEIGRHLVESLSLEEREVLLERLRRYIDTIAALPTHERLRYQLACPFLNSQNQCGIYSVRPLVCRMHHSLSRAACEDAESGIPVIEDFVEATIPVMEGVFDAATDAGMVPGELELAPAILLVLDEPGAEGLWLQGEDVFAGTVDLFLREYAESKLAQS